MKSILLRILAFVAFVVGGSMLVTFAGMALVRLGTTLPASSGAITLGGSDFACQLDDWLPYGLAIVFGLPRFRLASFCVILAGELHRAYDRTYPVERGDET
jgi:hypothetical protein